MPDREIAAHLGRARGTIKKQRHKMGLLHYKKRKWSQQEEEIVEKYYPDTDNDKILAMLPGISILALYRKAYQLGVKKSDAYMEKQLKELGKTLLENGKRHWFEKGHTPYNKGMKQEEYMSEDAIERTKKTRFEKGHTPKNTKWDGAITIRNPHKDRGASPEVWIRLAEGEWMQYSRYMYEKYMGAIPEGYLITFKDGNSLNCFPENLEAITRGQNVRRNFNGKKVSKHLKEYYADNPHPGRDLSDNFVASRLAGGDPQLKEYILKERPGLIKVARANYQLKRKLKEAKNG